MVYKPTCNLEVSLLIFLAFIKPKKVDEKSTEQVPGWDFEAPKVRQSDARV